MKIGELFELKAEKEGIDPKMLLDLYYKRLLVRITPVEIELNILKQFDPYLSELFAIAGSAAKNILEEGLSELTAQKDKGPN